MIFKLSKSNCYSIDSSLILDNKYINVEGKIYETSINSKTLASGEMITHYGWDLLAKEKTVTVSGGVNVPGTVKYKVYYKVIDLGTLVSDEPLTQEINSYTTKLSVKGDVTKTETATYSETYPDINITAPSSLAPSDVEKLAKKWLGICTVYYARPSLYEVGVIAWVISKVEYDITLYNNSAPAVSDEVVIDQTVNYQVIVSAFKKEAIDFSKGEEDPLLTYKLPNNELLTTDTKYQEQSLVEKICGTILNNYKRGKQVVTIECPTLDVIDTNGNVYNNFIFENGQYFYIEDQVGNSLFYYKLTNIAKLFELISAEYSKEVWTLILKEVAIKQNESN